MAIEVSKLHEQRPRIRLGMVGGGQGAFIGTIHRIAARVDDRYELLAGALSSDPSRAAASAAELHIAADRIYSSFYEMAEREAARSDGVEAVSIVTPNNLHFPAAKAFLEAGIHVICDKPLTTTSAEAEELVALAEQSGKVFAVTYNYTGYPMIRQARAMVAAGELGKLRLVNVEFAQDWLTGPVEQSGSKQAEWRTDPNRAGAGGCIGDIGTHAYNLASFVSGLKTDALLAQLTSFVDGRRVDDDARILLRYKGDAHGMLWASQVAPGNENALGLRIYGDRAGLEWNQADPNYLWFTRLGEPKQVLTRGGSGVWQASQRVTRTPGGHPEGYLEGFATIYTEVALAIEAARMGETASDEVIYPSIRDGLDGMYFIETAITSSRTGNVWTKIK